VARIALDTSVRAVATQLGVSLRADPTTVIVDRCVQKVTAWATELGPVTAPDELLDVVCEKLRLRFEVVETDHDLVRIKNTYLAQKELAFIDLEREFNASTDAVVIRLQHQPSWSNVRYVAVVDGRASKRPRVWFSKWHEVAHLLAEPQTKFVFRRTQAFKREPVERLMDQIAGALAFYEPLFLPSLMASGVDLARPRLQMLVDFCGESCGHASLLAAMTAAMRHLQIPALLVEAKPALKSSERVSVRPNGIRVATESGASAVLRAVTSVHNPAALRTRMFIHRNMRVPDRSVVAKVFAGRSDLEHHQVSECLSLWESGGEHLPTQAVLVEAMMAGRDRVLALFSA
jgi:hypothetical protein